MLAVVVPKVVVVVRSVSTFSVNGAADGSG